MPDASTATEAPPPPQANPADTAIIAQFNADRQTPDNLAIQQFNKDRAGSFGLHQALEAAQRGVELGAGQAVTGITGFLGNVFNPEARYRDMDAPTLLGTIGHAQETINGLQARLDKNPTDQFTREVVEPQMGQLKGDITAARHALELKSGVAPETDPIKETGDWLLYQHMQNQRDLSILRGEAPIPPPQNWMERLDAIFGTRPSPDNLSEGNWARNLIETGGQLAGQAPFFMTGELPAEAAALFGQGYENQERQAAQAHADLRTQFNAGTLGGIASLLQLPAYKLAFGNAMGFKPAMDAGELAKRVVKAALVGGATSTANTVADNIIAQLTQYNPKRTVSQGWWDSMVSGSVLMGLTGAAVETPSYAMKVLMGRGRGAYMFRPSAAAQAPPQGGPTPTTPAGAGPEAAQKATAEQLAAELRAKILPTAAQQPAETQAPEADSNTNSAAEQATANPVEAETAKPTTAEAEKPTAAPQDITARITDAYRALSAERGRRSVPIADVLERAGVPVPEGKRAIRALGDQVQLDTGDWSVATDAHRAAAIEQAGRQRLYMALEPTEGEEAAARRSVAPTPTVEDTEPRLRSAEEAVDEIKRRMGNGVQADVWGNKPWNQIPLRFQRVLRDSGRNLSNLIGFTDRDTGRLWVNPNATPEEVNALVVGNYLPTYYNEQGRFNVLPVTSFQQVKNSPAIAAMLQRFPDADLRNAGAVDPASRNVILNLNHIMAQPDPIRTAIGTITHEVGTHIGLRSQFKGDDEAMNGFLDRVWRGLNQDGKGDQLAAQFGASMEGLARNYNLIGDDENLDDLSQEGRRRLAEEMLARYSEQFDPAQLDRAPNVVQRAAGFIRDGFNRQNGLNFDNGEAFRFLRDAFSGIEPERIVTPEDQEALAKRIGYAEILESPEDTANNQVDLADLADGVRRPNREPGAAYGEPATSRSLLSSTKKLLNYVAGNPDLAIAPETVDRDRAGQPMGGEEHRVTRAAGGPYVIAETKPDGRYGPYGLAVTLPRPDSSRGTEQVIRDGTDHYAYTGAHADQYAQSILIRNGLDPSFQTHIEGITTYPGDQSPRFITSRPELRTEEWGQSDYEQRNAYFGKLGFQPIDDRTYYNPDTRVLLADMHGGNVWVNRAEPTRLAMIDGFAAELNGRLMNHLEQLLENGAYDKWHAENRQNVLDIQNQALQFNMGAGAGFEEREPTTAELAAEEAWLKERGDENPWSFLMKREEGSVAGGMSEERRKAMQLSVLTALESGGAKGFSEVGLKQQYDPRNPERAKQFAASPTGWTYDKTGKPIWDEDTAKIYGSFGGDTQQVMNYWLSKKFFDDGNKDDLHNYLYHALANDLREQIGQARDANNPDRAQQLENALGTLNQRFKETGVAQGQAFVARKYANPPDAFLADAQAEADKAIDREVKRDGNFSKARDAVRDVLKDVNGQILSEVDPIIRVTQEKSDALKQQSLPEQLADAVAKNVVEQAARAKAGPKALGALNEMFADFKTAIGQMVRDQGIQMTPAQRERTLRSTQMLRALDNLPWFRESWDRMIGQAQERFGGDPDMQHAFALLDNAMQAPFSQQQIRGLMGELQLPSISDLVTEHRSQQRAVIDTMADYLVRNSNLSRADAMAVDGAISRYVRGAVDEKRQAALEQVLDRYAGKDPSGRPMSMERLIGLIHMGAFDDRAVSNALAPSFGLKTITPELAGSLRDLTDKLAQYNLEGRQGWQTNQIVYQLNQALDKWRNEFSSWPERWGANLNTVFMGNILSGLGTHIVPPLTDFFNGLGNIASRWWALPSIEARAMALPKILENYFDPLTRSGLTRFGYIWKYGIDPTGDVLRYAGVGAEKQVPALLTPYKYVFRLITATHALMAAAPERTAGWLYAFDQAAKTGGNLMQAMAEADRLLYGGAGDLDAAKETASNEGHAPGSLGYNLRVQELIDQKQPENIRSMARMYGIRSIFTQAPEGILGSAVRTVQRFTSEQPWARYIVPFTTVVSNVINESINYSPFGLTRYLVNQHMTDWAHFLKADPDMTDETLNVLKADMLFKASVGTASLAGIAALQNIKGPDGRPIIQIHGHGPSKLSDRNQLLDAGWSSNSIEFNIGGGKSLYVPFEAAPIAVGLGMIGNYMDGMRYEKYPAGSERALLYAASNIGNVFFDRSFLHGLTNFLDAFHGADNPQDAVRNMRTELAGLSSGLPYAGSAFLEQAWTQFVDNRLYEGGPPIIGSALRMVPMMNWIDGSRPRLNVLGEEIHLDPMTKRYYTLGSSDPVWQLLENRDAFLEDPRTQKIQGRAMSEEQTYNFMKFRGEYLRQQIEQRMPLLQSVDDDRFDELKKSLEAEATRRAKADVIRGRDGTPWTSVD